MYGREKRVLLRHYLEQGLKKTELAQKLGLHRRTIHHWIETGQLDRELDDEFVRYTPRPAVAKKLDPYCGIIQARLEEFPRLSAKRLFDEIRAAGYTGGYTQLKEHVRRARPAPPPEPLVRFETAPGHQAQVDFASFTLPWGRRYALLVVLGYSRLLWLHFYSRQTMQTLFRGLEAAFEFFGGVPAELLFDQMSAVITEDRRNDGGTLVENAEFLRFAHHHGFKVRACRPYRAKTKGKVERPIRYMRDSFFYGRTFLNDPDLDAQAEHWLGHVANVRCHATTKERPIERFERHELATLKPLALKPYRSLILPTSATAPAPKKPSVPAIAVERRPLAHYDRLVGAGT
jgi:transposase